MPRSIALSCAGLRALPRRITTEPASIMAQRAVSLTLRAVVTGHLGARSQKSRVQGRKPETFCFDFRLSTFDFPLVDGDFLEQVELAERLAGAEDDAQLRVVRDGHRQRGLLAQEHIQVAQLR